MFKFGCKFWICAKSSRPPGSRVPMSVKKSPISDARLFGVFSLPKYYLWEDLLKVNKVILRKLAPLAEAATFWEYSAKFHQDQTKGLTSGALSRRFTL